MNSHQAAGAVNCGKSTNTMHNTDLLEDLVGMIGLAGDDDDDMDLDSNYQYGEDIRSPQPQYNSRGHSRRPVSPIQNGLSKHDNFRYGATFNGAIGAGDKRNKLKQSGAGAGWRDFTKETNGVVRPGSSTNATLRDARSRANERGRKKNQRRSNDNKSDLEIELNSLARDSHHDLGDLDDDDESYRYGARVNGAGNKKQGKQMNGYHGVDSKRREVLEDSDRSRL